MNRDKLMRERREDLQPLIMFVKALIEKHGREKAKELVWPAFLKYAENRFVREYDNVPEQDRWAIFREGVEKMGDGTFYTVDAKSDNAIKIKYTWCTFWEVFKEYELEDFVPIYCQTDFETCRMIHPKIKLERTRILADGADFCDHCWKYEE